jgi:hypothetical protein
MLLKNNKVDTDIESFPCEQIQPQGDEAMDDSTIAFNEPNRQSTLDQMTKSPDLTKEGNCLRLLTYNFFLRPIVADDDNNDWKKERLRIFCET